jgi:hypothetical protein
MTDLVSPPPNPSQQKAWARQVLKDFPPNSQAVGAQEIRRWALAILRQPNRQPGKSVRLQFPPLVPPLA